MVPRNCATINIILKFQGNLEELELLEPMSLVTFLYESQI